MIVRLLAFALIAEALFGGLRVAELISRLGGYDPVAVTLISCAGLLGALQFMGGWLLASRRPQGFSLAQWAFAGAALITPFDVGMGLAPTSVYPWLRWQVTIAYDVYAIAALLYLRWAARLRYTEFHLVHARSKPAFSYTRCPASVACRRMRPSPSSRARAIDASTSAAATPRPRHSGPCTR